MDYLCSLKFLEMCTEIFEGFIENNGLERKDWLLGADCSYKALVHSDRRKNQLVTEVIEEELIRRVKARDEEAWSELYDLHYSSLYRYAFARLRSREEAEDIASQVFLEALRGVDRYEYRGRPLLAWLYRIARNLIADDMRRQVRKTRAATLIQADPSFAPAADESIETMELLEAISPLTVDQQEVLIQRFFMALSARETAQLLGKNETAVFSLQVRAISSLRRLISSESPALEVIPA